MKEVTYEDWEKNPTPRMMWVWDDDECQREKIKVIYFKKTDAVLYPVVTMSDDEQETGVYTHCAEIEEPRRMTNYDLAKWLSDGARLGEFREYKNPINTLVASYRSYREENKNEPCDEGILIRVNGGDWHEPLVEVEE